MNRSYKFRIYPSQEQEEILVQWLGFVRVIWNKMLSDNIEQYEKDKTFKWGKQWSVILPPLKKEHEWLKMPPSQSLQQKCDDLDKALRACTRKNDRAGFPKFKSKRDLNQSLRIPIQNGNFKIHSREMITIPKMKGIKALIHRHISGDMKNLTLKREGDKWFVVVVTEMEGPIKSPTTKETSVGIDMGLTDFAILSDGTRIKTPKFYREKEKGIARLQRRLCRQKKGSNRYKKTRARLRRAHEKIKNQRHNFIHQERRKIANSFSGIFVEDLNVNAIKSRFGKSVSDQGWAMFLFALSYKSNEFGKIGRFEPSSKYCSVCQVRHESLPLSTRKLPCCGIDRDDNSSYNILNWGYEKYTSGTEGSARGFVLGSDGAIDPSNSDKDEARKVSSQNWKPRDL